MCDEDTMRDAEEHLRRSRILTRRAFGALSAGAGLAMMQPRAAATPRCALLFMESRELSVLSGGGPVEPVDPVTRIAVCPSSGPHCPSRHPLSRGGP